MKNYLLFIILSFATISCFRYGNFKLKNEVINGNHIYYENKLDFNSVYVHQLQNYKDSSYIFRFMRFFPNGRMFLEYGHSSINTSEKEHYNRINNNDNYHKGQKTYYIFLDSITIKFEHYENNELGYYYNYAKIKGDTIQIYKMESQTLFKKTYEFNEKYYIKKEIDLKPVEVDW